MYMSIHVYEEFLWLHIISCNCFKICFNILNVMYEFSLRVKGHFSVRYHNKTKERILVEILNKNKTFDFIKRACAARSLSG